MHEPESTKSAHLIKRARKTAVIVASLLVTSAALPATLPDRADLSLRDLSGDSQAIEDYSGLVIVLNFWATWCVPCRDEMPLLDDVQERYADRGVVVVGASADDASAGREIAASLAEENISFPIWTGATAADMERFGLSMSLPATAIIDQEGRIAFRIVGIVKRRQIARRLEYLLSGRHGRAPKRLVDSLPDTAGHGEDDEHEHDEGEDHGHGGVGIEGASLVPS